MNTKKYEELLVLLRSHKTDKEILEVLSDYHENLQAPWNTADS